MFILGLCMISNNLCKDNIIISFHSPCKDSPCPPSLVGSVEDRGFLTTILVFSLGVCIIWNNFCKGNIDETVQIACLKFTVYMSSIFVDGSEEDRGFLMGPSYWTGNKISISKKSCSLGP